MEEPCPGTSHYLLSALREWDIREMVPASGSLALAGVGRSWDALPWGGKVTRGLAPALPTPPPPSSPTLRNSWDSTGVERLQGCWGEMGLGTLAEGLPALGWAWRQLVLSGDWTREGHCAPGTL